MGHASVYTRKYIGYYSKNTFHEDFLPLFPRLFSCASHNLLCSFEKKKNGVQDRMVGERIFSWGSPFFFIVPLMTGALFLSFFLSCDGLVPFVVLLFFLRRFSLCCFYSFFSPFFSSPSSSSSSFHPLKGKDARRR